VVQLVHGPRKHLLAQPLYHIELPMVLYQEGNFSWEGLTHLLLDIDDIVEGIEVGLFLGLSLQVEEAVRLEVVDFVLLDLFPWDQLVHVSHLHRVLP